jgi:hypothetical protein
MKSTGFNKGSIRNAILHARDGFKTLGIVLRNYRLLFSLSLYWDELSKLNWWLLWSDDAFEMEARVDAEYEKYWKLHEFARFSKRHDELLDEFLSHGIQCSPRPPRPT